MAHPTHRPHYNHHLTSGAHASPIKSWPYAAAAGLVLSGPLVGMSALSFIAAVTLLVIASPVLLIFSPLLLGAGLFLVVVMAAFGVAAVMGVAGLSSLAWIFRSTTRFLRGGNVNDANMTGVLSDGVVDTTKDGEEEEEEEVKEVLIGNEEAGKEGDSDVDIERDAEKETNKGRIADDVGREAAPEKEGKDKQGGSGGDNANVNADRSAEKESDRKRLEEEGKHKEGDNANVDFDRAAEKNGDGEDVDGDKSTESKGGSGKETKKKKKGRDKASSK